MSFVITFFLGVIVTEDWALEEFLLPLVEDIERLDK